MNMKEMVKRIKRNPVCILNPILRKCRYLIPDKLYLTLLFRSKVGYRLNLKNPRGFNEKLQWLKLYDRNPSYTMMVDKYTVKEYVKEKWGEQYVIPTLGVWSSFDEIEFDKLPSKFVLKCTHDSGGVVIVNDKNHFDKDAAKTKLEKCLKRNFYWSGREYPYKNIKPRIIAEQYISNLAETPLNDYKLMCFNGHVKCSFVCSNRYGKEGLYVNFYDETWKPMQFIRKYPRNPIEIQKPHQYSKMVALAEDISRNIPFIRVDFYECENKIYFGEFTFYPGSGIEWFDPLEWDFILGDWLKLPLEDRG